MNDFFKKIIAPQVDFEGEKNLEKFVKTFFELYRIEIFRDGLDLILTKLAQQQLRFEVKIVKGWDTNLGCFLTEQKSFYDKTLGKILRRQSPKIILRNLSHNLMAHEMAHAFEFESGLNLGEEFRSCIGFDMKNREAPILTLRGEVKRLMVEALKSYKPEQFISELFARYFELLSISRNVCEVGSFSTLDVTSFFENTTNFVEKIFNPQIKAKIDPKIAAATLELTNQIKLEIPTQKFSEKIESTQKKSSGLWSKTTKSNASWQMSWNKSRELDDKK
jgi:hypothetical protein